MDYLIFAIYEKTFALDIISGNIEKKKNRYLRFFFNGIKKTLLKIIKI